MATVAKKKNELTCHYGCKKQLQCLHVTRTRMIMPDPKAGSPLSSNKQKIAPTTSAEIRQYTLGNLTTPSRINLSFSLTLCEICVPLPPFQCLGVFALDRVFVFRLWLRVSGVNIEMGERGCGNAYDIQKKLRLIVEGVVCFDPIHTSCGLEKWSFFRFGPRYGKSTNRLEAN